MAKSCENSNPYPILSCKMLTIFLITLLVSEIFTSEIIPGDEQILKNEHLNSIENVKNRLQNAISLYENGNYEEAFTQLEFLAINLPEIIDTEDMAINIAIRSWLCKTTMKLRNCSSALEASVTFEKDQLVYPDPSFIETWENLFNLGTCLKAVEEFTNAEQVFSLLLQLMMQTNGDKEPEILKVRNLHLQATKGTGDYETAAAGLQQLHIDLINIYGDLHPETIKARLEYGDCLYRMGSYETAKYFLDATLYLMEELYGSSHPETLEARVTLLEQAALVKDCEDFEPEFQPLTTALEKGFGPHGDETIKHAYNHAVCLYYMGEKEKAQNLFEATLKRSEAQNGEKYPKSLQIKSWLIGLRQDEKNLEDTLKEYESFIPVVIEVFGKSEQFTLEQRDNYATCLYQLKKYEKAKTEYEAILKEKGKFEKDHKLFQGLEEMLRKVNDYIEFGEPLMKEMAQRWNKVLQLVDDKDYLEASLILEKLVPEQESTLGIHHPITLDGLYLYGLSLFHTERYEEAEEILLLVLSRENEGFKHQDPERTLASRNLLFTTFLRLNKCREILEITDTVFNDAINQFGPNHSTVFEIVLEYTLCLFDLQKFPETREQSFNLIEKMSEVIGPKDLGTIKARNRIGQKLLHSGDYSFGKEFLENLVTDCLEFFGENHDETHSAMNNYAVSLYYLEEYDVAVEKFNYLLSLVGEESEKGLNARAWLGKIFFATGDYFEEAKHLKTYVKNAEKLFGPIHERVLKFRESYARALFKMGEFEKAKYEVETIMEFWMKGFGELNGTVEKLGEFLDKIVSAMEMRNKGKVGTTNRKEL